jgi:hypothetical protein
MKNHRMDLDGGGHAPRISPSAVFLTAAAVVAAMVVGLAGPRLRDRHGSAQQELPIGELAYAAEYREAQQAFDVARRALGGTSSEEIGAKARQVFGQEVLAPDLSAAGLVLRDARVVELAPDSRALALLHRRAQGDGTVTLYGLRDEGRFVRLDGFGRAPPLAPGDEWIGLGQAERDGPPRVIYAVTDGSVLWLMLAPDAETVVRLAGALAPQVHGERPATETPATGGERPADAPPQRGER